MRFDLHLKKFSIKNPSESDTTYLVLGRNYTILMVKLLYIWLLCTTSNHKWGHLGTQTFQILFHCVLGFINHFNINTKGTHYVL